MTWPGVDIYYMPLFGKLHKADNKDFIVDNVLIARSSRQRCSVKKVLLETFCEFYRTTSVSVSLFNKSLLKNIHKRLLLYCILWLDQTWIEFLMRQRSKKKLLHGYQATLLTWLYIKHISIHQVSETTQVSKNCWTNYQKCKMLGENIHQMEWYGDRCLFWDFTTKFYESIALTGKLVISLSRIPTMKILADTKECRELVKSYRFKTGNSFEIRYYKVIDVDFPWTVVFSCMQLKEK